MILKRTLRLLYINVAQLMTHAALAHVIVYYVIMLPSFWYITEGNL